MSKDKTYTLEYWIEPNEFSSKEELEKHITGKLNKLAKDVNIKVDDRKDKYLILRITSTKKYIDACHDKLDFDRKWAIRAKDELGDCLRAEAFPVLAEIELSLRHFINQAMIEVLGFDWWNSFSPDKMREKVKEVENKAKDQVKFHHPIEFTLFDDLIKIVTEKFQKWSNERAITVSDLLGLLSVCKSIEDIQKEIDERRKEISFWDDIFSNYFADKDSWIKLKETIEEIIPTRNKVMHHRLFRLHQLVTLRKHRDEVNRVIGLAKTELLDTELKDAQQNSRIIIEGLTPVISAEFSKELASLLQSPNLGTEISKGLASLLQPPNLGAEISKGLASLLQPPNLGTEIKNLLQQLTAQQKQLLEDKHKADESDNNNDSKND
jgi:hypothetical protein